MTSKAVSILESSIVTPAAETPRRSIWLTNLDLNPRLRMYATTIYIYRRTGGQDPASFFSTARVKEGLAKVLVPFYPFAGMLGFDDDGRIELKCTGEGAKYVEAVCDSTIDEFGDFSPSQHLKELLVPFPASAEPPCPVLLFQITRFKCGGVCLGVATHHTMADGTSAFHFISSWAAVTRGVDLSTITPPYIDCTNLRARSPLRVEYDHADIAPSTRDTSTQTAKPQTAVSSAVVTISKEQIDKLKDLNKGLTTFLAVTLRAWQCSCRARGLAASENTILTFPINIRNRLQPPLPREYLGNGLWSPFLELTVGELLSSSVESIASKIKASIARVDDGYLRSAIDFLEQEDVPNRGTSRPIPCHHFLYAISWLGLSTDEIDFGWGRPMLMYNAQPPLRGGMYIISDPNNDGGVNLVLPQDEYVSAFKEHFYADDL